MNTPKGKGYFSFVSHGAKIEHFNIKCIKLHLENLERDAKCADSKPRQAVDSRMIILTHAAQDRFSPMQKRKKNPQKENYL
jgi:hypothetical protein